jgi:hypothetical protein
LHWTLEEFADDCFGSIPIVRLNLVNLQVSALVTMPVDVSPVLAAD